MGEKRRYQGDNTVCDDGFCGSCCHVDATCDPTISSECDDPLDAFIPATTCDNPAVSCENRGACCRGDGSCDVVGASECDDPLDSFSYATTCGDLVPPCEAIGACCRRIDGFCDVVGESLCDDAQDDFIPATTCGDLDPPCEAMGACCSPDHVCEDPAFESSCVAQADHTFHVGQTCAADLPCEPMGACCIDGLCSVLKRFDCLQDGGVFSEDIPDCNGDPPPCALGACCTEISSGVLICDDEIMHLACSGPSENFHVSEDCGLDRPCDPKGACCVSDQCTDDQAEILCEDGGGSYRGDGSRCDVSCGACGPDQILSSVPLACTIDALYPHEPDNVLARLGFNEIELTLDCDPASLEFQDILVTVVPDDVGATFIDAITPVDGDTVLLTFHDPIPPGHWTCIEIVTANQKICIGSLPGDVNLNRRTTTDDLLDLVDFLNGVVGAPSLEPWQCDIDRDDNCLPADILAEIDLLLGVGAFNRWGDASLPACPSVP